MKKKILFAAMFPLVCFYRVVLAATAVVLTVIFAVLAILFVLFYGAPSVYFAWRRRICAFQRLPA